MIMERLRETLAEIAPPLVDGCQVHNGMLIGAPGWAVMALPNHTDDPSHFDIGFAASLESTQPSILSDCITGLGPPHEAAAMMAHIWSQTSGACFAEMLTRRGEYASHLDDSDSAGLPGWHSIVSGVLAYGPDSSSSGTLQAALLDHEVLRTLGVLLTPALDRSTHNAIKVFYQRAPISAVAEIRINGVPHPEASRALAELLWPEVAAPAIARFYAVAVNPT